MTTIENEESFFLEYKPKYKIFHELMALRMKNVLLVSSYYDSFLLEEDGRLSDQIYEEFQNLNLRTLPRITRVSSAKEALAVLQENKNFDLVITMRRLGDIDAFSFGKNVKELKDIPVILLLTSVVEIKFLPEREERKGIDGIFVWNGDSKIFVAIIKHLEDRINADYDTKHGLVRVFIFIEDSIRFYSLLLPELYSQLMKQTHRLIAEGVNDFQDLLKMKARPKILLAETYEEAEEYYRKYKENVMGIISDVEYPLEGEITKNAAFRFIEDVLEGKTNLPIALLSTQDRFSEEAKKMNCYFIHKKSHGLLWDLNKWLLDYVGFGDFVFRTADGKEVGRAKDIVGFYEMIKTIPIDSLIYHGKNDHFSSWLAARGEFEIAQKLKPRKVSEFESHELREFLLKSVEEIVLEKTRGIINDFSRENYHPDILFLRLRPGSLGGKGRGIAFLMFLLNYFQIRDEFRDVSIRIPKTIVIGTDEFNKFMEDNNLYEHALSDVADNEIKERFVNAKLSKSLRDDLKLILRDLTGPLAVRSSSILEDSAYQPFAGIFSTHMIPNNASNTKTRLEQLCTAVKLVYASTFFKLAKSYAETVGQVVEESKMAVVIQRVVGKKFQHYFYPNFSGTASSNNFYPIGDKITPDDKIAFVALGLGKTIVDGEKAIRFYPEYPKMNLYSTPELLLESTQKSFYAIDLSQKSFDLAKDDPFITKLDLGDAIEHEVLGGIADTFDYNTQAIRHGYYNKGSPVITFNKQLKLGTFPLAEIVTKILDLGERAMGSPVEIEYACNFGKTKNEPCTFYILQIRPYLQQEELLLEDFSDVKEEKLLVYSNRVSGNLIRKDIQDILFVKPETFDKTKTLDMVSQIDELNNKLVDEGKPYLIIGFGRWGTADRFLGIPVKWNNISGAQVIIENSLKDFRVDFSQGSHFFHNIITSNIGYLYVDYGSDEQFIDWPWLLEQKTITETEFIRHVRTKIPLVIRIDGKKREGIIIKNFKEHVAQ